jgi:hypothetical protein
MQIRSTVVASPSASSARKIASSRFVQCLEEGDRFLMKFVQTQEVDESESA